MASKEEMFCGYCGEDINVDEDYFIIDEMYCCMDCMSEGIDEV